MNEITLAGCTPTPLASYLKALGVLRLLSAKYPRTRGFWRGDQFVLHSELDRAGVAQFFLHDYVPTPIMAPWNAGSGFYYQERKSKEVDPATGKKKKLGVFDQETAATKTLATIIDGNDPRLVPYRQALKQALHAVQTAALVTAPDSGKSKDDFILSLRGTLPDQCVLAMDAGLAISGGKTDYPPLLGSGWNDGNLDFTSNFMQRITDVLGTRDAVVPEPSPAWLESCLFGSNASGLTKDNIGQFSPSQAGGYNASSGFDGDALINPWDFVLMVEGALLFASSVVRRHAHDPQGVMGYPFTVRIVNAGAGNLGEGDASAARGEIWVPLWPQPSTYEEVRTLMAEGRVARDGRPAKDALDFVRAIQHLGGYRGVKSFQRYGLLKRNGKAFFATPLSRVAVSTSPQARWLDDLDRNGWLERFRRFAQGDNIPKRFLSCRRQLEDALFAYSGREPSKAETQSLLVLLGTIQAVLANSNKARKEFGPIPRLSEQWVVAADDGTSAFRIAKALAGLRDVGGESLPLRAQLFPVERHRDAWMTPKTSGGFRICSGQQGRLIETLHVLLERRLWLAEKLGMDDKPLRSAAGVNLGDLLAFLQDGSLDARIAALLPGLALCAIPKDTEHSGGHAAIPAAFALLKLSLTPDTVLHSLGLLAEGQHLPMPIGMPAQLAAGNHGNRAVATAWRRLHASGIAPLFAPNALPTLANIDPLRACAALLIPLRHGATATLARSVTQQPEVNIA